MGTHLAGLIFFLNPALPFAAGPVLRGVAIYGALLGAVTLLLHLPVTWGRPRRARRMLPWTLTVALSLSALLDWAHASYYSWFLPPGINDRLIKTALWLTLGALISFYTALLHSLQRRRYGLRSRLTYGVIALLSVYAMVERREAYQAPRAASPRPATVAPSQRPRLWVVGIDSATLDAILPLAGQGRLPFFATLLQGGAYGRLETLSPTRRGAVWTTLATGKRPYKHGVLGRRPYSASFLASGAEMYLLPSGISFRHWGTLGNKQLPWWPRRRALALWEILPRLGVASGVVGWPEMAATPGEDLFALPETAFQGASEAVPSRIAGRFGPDAPRWMSDAMSADLRRHARTLGLAERNRRATAVFVLLPGLREVSRRTFGGFSAVQFEGEHRGGAARTATERLSSYYSALDSLLAEIWAQEKGPHLLAVVSAYGVYPQGGWRRLWGQMAPGTALGGEFLEAPDGVLLLYGEGVRPGELLTGARIVDLAPTLLYGLGFPVARDMDGKVLTSAFEPGFLARNPVTFFPSYEGLAKITP